MLDGADCVDREAQADLLAQRVRQQTGGLQLGMNRRLVLLLAWLTLLPT